MEQFLGAFDACRVLTWFYLNLVLIRHVLIASHHVKIFLFVFTIAGFILHLLLVFLGNLNDLIVEGMVLELLGNPEGWWVALVRYLKLIRFAFLHLRLLLRYLEMIIDHAVFLIQNPLVKHEVLESLRPILLLFCIEGQSWGNPWVISLILLIPRKVREFSFCWLLLGLVNVLRCDSPMLYLVK